MPVLTVLLAVLLDTSVIPVFYHGAYTIPLTLAVILCISLRLGKSRGALFGLGAGLLIDITAGTVPYNTVAYTAIGFLCALLVPEFDPRVSLKPLPFHARRAGISFLMALGIEIGMNLIIYINTASVTWRMVLTALARSGLMALTVLLICPVLTLVYPRATAWVDQDDLHREAEKY